jgi:hypothetical protein
MQPLDRASPVRRAAEPHPVGRAVLGAVEALVGLALGWPGASAHVTLAVDVQCRADLHQES